MMRFLVLAAAISSAPASAATIEVASGDWSNIPEIAYKGYPRVPLETAFRIQQSLANGECSLPGQSEDKFDLTVPFLVRFEPDGGVDKVVLQRLGCDRAESLTGQVLVKIIEAGGYKPSTKVNATGWYRGKIRVRAPRYRQATDSSF